MVATPQEAQAFIKRLDAAIAPLAWTHDVSNVSAHFLDIHIDTVFSHARDTVTLSTNMYRKPSLVPHYLPMNSDHPSSAKVGLFAGESRRAHLLCSSEISYSKCVEELRSFLAVAGYPMSACIAPAYDAKVRELRLQKALEPKSKTEPNRSKVYLALPFSSQLATLRFSKSFQTHVGGLVPLSLTVAWSMKPNSMRKLYQFDWPNFQSSSSTE